VGRIVVFVWQYGWFGAQGELDRYRASYAKDHHHLMTSGFGKGYNYEMKKFKLSKPKYLMIKTENLEQNLVSKEQKFTEFSKYLGL